MSDAIEGWIVTKLISQELKTEYREQISHHSLGVLFQKHCTVGYVKILFSFVRAISVLKE